MRISEISEVINRKFQQYYLDFSYTLGGIYHINDFKDIRTMVLTIGFNRSGSSLAGYLLTAHPNIVIADEIQHTNPKRYYPGEVGIVYLGRMYNGFLSNLFYAILYIDRLRYRAKISTTSNRNEAKRKVGIIRGMDRSGRYILVPNQSQGRFERLKVIGVKASVENVKALLMNNTLVSFNRKLKKKNIKLKFVSTIRNPYDIVARIRKEYKVMNDGFVCRNFEKFCKNHGALLKRIDAQDIFVNRHEDMCKDPRRQLARLCDFLEVPIPACYIEDCASQVAQEPYKSRLDIDWSPQLKQTVVRMIEKYDFFSGYD